MVMAKDLREKDSPLEATEKAPRSRRLPFKDRKRSAELKPRNGTDRRPEFHAVTAKPSSYDVIVLGAGASGLCAGLAAAERGAKTLIIERMDSPGKKLLATGNGRCNLSNSRIGPACYAGGQTRFLDPVLSEWTTRHMRDFWGELGLAIRTEDGRLYPYSLQARSVAQILTAAVANSGCELLCDTKAERILAENEASLGTEAPGKTCYRICCGENKTFWATTVILAAGGMAAPALGTDGEAYGLYTRLGHRLCRPRPALVQLVTEGIPKRLSGTRVRVELKLQTVGGGKRREKGELLFTDYGLSGICALDLSSAIGELLEEQKKLTLLIDFLPDMGEEQALRYAFNLRRVQPGSPAALWGEGLLPEKISTQIFMDQYADLIRVRGLSPRAARQSEYELMASLEDERLLRLVRLAKAWPAHVVGTKGFGFAQTTAGGLDTRDFNPYTLESLRCPGLYACGEILDVTGRCGGYNLHWAFASGSTAGRHAALSGLKA